jgi:hypothetical protein
MDKMKRQVSWFGLVLVTALALLANPIFSQDPKKTEKSAKDDPTAAMMKLGAPGANHKHLNSLAGKWDAKVKFWMDPSKPPEEMEGSCERHWILGGRFLHEEFKGKAMGAPFHGLGLVGYDNLKKKFVSAWVDNMSTALMTSEGTYDADKKTFTFTSKGKDPYTGQVMKNRDVLRLVGGDKQVSEMYKQPPKGKEFKMLEIVYTRKK